VLSQQGTWGGERRGEIMLLYCFIALPESVEGLKACMCVCSPSRLVLQDK